MVGESNIARRALEKCVSDHIAKRDGTKLFIEVSTAENTDEDIKDLYNLIFRRFLKVVYNVSMKNSACG